MIPTAAPTYGQDVHPPALAMQCQSEVPATSRLETNTDVKIQCVEKVAKGECSSITLICRRQEIPISKWAPGRNFLGIDRRDSVEG